MRPVDEEPGFVVKLHDILKISRGAPIVLQFNIFATFCGNTFNILRVYCQLLYRGVRFFCFDIFSAENRSRVGVTRKLLYLFSLTGMKSREYVMLMFPVPF